MKPQKSSGRTTHHSMRRGSGRGSSGGRFGRMMRNGYALMHHPIRSIRCWNRSHNYLWTNIDEINLRSLKDSGQVVKYNACIPGFFKC